MKRSVLRKIDVHRQEVIDGAGVGTDCAVLSFADADDVVLSAAPVNAPVGEVSACAVTTALNNIAAGGAEPVGVLLSILLPENTEEEALRYMMEQARDICRACGVQIVGGHTEVAPGVLYPVVTATGIGKRQAGRAMRGVGPNMDLVVSKWIGLEGTVRLAVEHRQELCARYPARMIDEAADYRRFLSVIPEAATAVKSGACGMHDVSGGGIYAALWELAQRAGVGLAVDLKKIPVRQETIEICEFFGLNPYELLSGGCLLMAAENGAALVEALEREDIPAAVIGQTTEGSERVVYNDGEKRYLDKPKTDQIYYAAAEH